MTTKRRRRSRRRRGRRRRSFAYLSIAHKNKLRGL
jgi:hypothetical protein